MEYHEKLRLLREERGFTQSGVAAVLGMPLPLYALVELGRKDLTVPQLGRLCRFYKVSADELLSLDAADSVPVTDTAPPARDESGGEPAPGPKKAGGAKVFFSSIRAGIAEAAEKDAANKSLRREKLEEAKRKNDY